MIHLFEDDKETDPSNDVKHNFLDYVLLTPRKFLHRFRDVHRNPLCSPMENFLEVFSGHNELRHAT